MIAAVCHLGFLKVGNFNSPYLRSANVRLRAKLFYADQSNRCGDMGVAVFRFFKMAAIRHLGLLYACLDHPQSSDLT